MANDEEWKAINELPPPQNLADAVERLMSVLYWLDANGQPWAAIDINNALEKLLGNN